MFGRGDGQGTLYLPGMLAAAQLPNVVAATKDALRDMGVAFVMLDGFETSGYHAWFAGYEELFITIKKRNEALLKQHHIRRVITNDPHEAFTLRERYGIDARHVLEVFDEHSGKIAKKEATKARYHHPCFLDRLGVPEKTAIRVLRRAGFHIEGGAPPGCCGSVGDDFARNDPPAAERVAAARAKRLGDGTIVTSCPYCYVAFKREKRKVMDIAEALGEG